MDQDDIKGFEERTNAAKERNFTTWMNDPMTRLGLSLIPGGENADALRLLLRSAFEAGVITGQGGMAIEVLGHMMKRNNR